MITFQIDFFVDEELRILREHDHELLQEVDKLKAALFMRHQDSAAVAEGKHREELLGSIKERTDAGFEAGNTLDIEENYKALSRSYAIGMHKAGKYVSSHSARGNTATPKEKGVAEGVSAGSDGKGDAANGDDQDDKDKISVSRREYESLVCDHAAQERLLDAFQKENDRLARLAKERESEQQLRSAVFYDQREGLNKELNRLKNANRAAGGSQAATEAAHPPPPPLPTANMNINIDEVPIPTSKKTSEALRMELQMDSTIRALKEQLAEAQGGLGDRERDLQVVIEKLRKENGELAAATTAANAALANHRMSAQENDYLQLQTENRTYVDEISHLKRKLAWFAQNQKLLDASDEESRASRAAVTALRRELLSKGADSKAIDRLLASTRIGTPSAASVAADEEGSVAPSHHAADRSMTMSVAGDSKATAGRSGHRSFADVKKIK